MRFVLTLLACDGLCGTESTLLPGGLTWEQRVDQHAAAAFDGEQCSEERPQAIKYRECEYASDPTLYIPEWIYFDRNRREESGSIVATFTAFFGIFRDEAVGGARGCLFDPDGEEDDFEWYAELTETRSDGDWTWPGAARFGDAALLRSPTEDSFPLTDRAGSYGWLCLESVPPVDGLEDAESAWRGVMFLHSETKEEDDPADYMLLFDGADCVTAESTVDWEYAASDHECTGDADGIDNDYDGVVDEGPDLDGDGAVDCVE